MITRLHCAECGGTDFDVLSGRISENAPWREVLRECLACKNEIFTFETSSSFGIIEGGYVSKEEYPLCAVCGEPIFPDDEVDIEEVSLIHADHEEIPAG